MSSTVLYMSMSLDGFIADRDENPDRLHRWIFPDAEGGDFDAAVARLQGVNRQIYDEFMSTGAVVAGRGTFEPAGGWGGDHHGDAKQAAGGKDVLVHGAGIAQRALKAGILDEIEIHLVPVLLGEGRRLFEDLGVEPRELERTRVLEGDGGVVHLRFAVRL